VGHKEFGNLIIDCIIAVNKNHKDKRYALGLPFARYILLSVPPLIQ
jgi:hypothetical protein